MIFLAIFVLPPMVLFCAPGFIRRTPVVVAGFVLSAILIACAWVRLVRAPLGQGPFGETFSWVLLWLPAVMWLCALPVNLARRHVPRGNRPLATLAMIAVGPLAFAATGDTLGQVPIRYVELGR